MEYSSSISLYWQKGFSFSTHNTAAVGVGDILVHGTRLPSSIHAGTNSPVLYFVGPRVFVSCVVQCEIDILEVQGVNK